MSDDSAAVHEPDGRVLEVSRRGRRVTLRVSVPAGVATIDLEPDGSGVRAFVHRRGYAIGYRGDASPGVEAARWVSDRLFAVGLEAMLAAAPELSRAPRATPLPPEPLVAVAQFVARIGGAPDSIGLELARLRRGAGPRAMFELSVRLLDGALVSGPRVTCYQQGGDPGPALASMSELLGRRAIELRSIRPHLEGLGAHASVAVWAGQAVPKLYLTVEQPGASEQLLAVAEALGGRPWPARDYAWLGATFSPDGRRRLRLYESRPAPETPSPETPSPEAPGAAADARELHGWDAPAAAESSATYQTFLEQPLALDVALDTLAPAPPLRLRLAEAFAPHTCRILARGRGGDRALYAHAGGPGSTASTIRGPLIRS